MEVGLVSLENNFVPLETVKEHMAHLGQVIPLVRDAGLASKFKKRLFLAQETDPIGLVIRPSWLKSSIATNVAIKKLEDQANRTEFPSFQGLSTLFRLFLPILSCEAAPLHKKRGKVKLKISKRCG